MTNVSTHIFVNRRRKAAILISALGEIAAQKLYRDLDESGLRIVTAEIADLKQVDAEEANQVLEEFVQSCASEGFLPSGGLEYARKLLVDAVGEERAKQLMEQITEAQKDEESHVESLQKADPQRIVKFLEGEHPQTIALVLAHMETKKASALLMLLPEAVRAQAVRRLAEVQQFSPEMARKIAMVLHRKLSSIGEQRQRAYSGFRAVADLMNRLEAEASRAILQEIETEDAKLALNIRNLMFTFQDLVTAPASAIREILAASDRKKLMLALKGAPDELRAQFFRAMSSRAVELLKEDIEELGPVRSRDVSQAQQALVTLARQLEAEGKIILRSGPEDDLLL
jgi:flagellar motor switch protein FliG